MSVVVIVLAAATVTYVNRDRTVRWESASGDGYGPAIVWPKGVPQLKGDDTGAWDAVLRWDALYKAAYNTHDLRVPQLEAITTPEFLADREAQLSPDSYYLGPSPLIPQSIEQRNDGSALVHACGSIEGPFAAQENVREDLSRHGAAIWTFALEPDGDGGWLVAGRGWNAEDGYCSVADAQIGLFDPAPVLPTLREKYGDEAYEQWFGTPAPTAS